jgi:hypothetical protein
MPCLPVGRREKHVCVKQQLWYYFFVNLMGSTNEAYIYPLQ